MTATRDACAPLWVQLDDESVGVRLRPVPHPRVWAGSLVAPPRPYATAQPPQLRPNWHDADFLVQC